MGKHCLKKILMDKGKYAISLHNVYYATRFPFYLWEFSLFFMCFLKVLISTPNSLDISL